MFKWLAKLRVPRTEVDTVRRGFYISDSIYVGEDSSMKTSAFYRGVIYISTQIAKLPWEVKDKENEILDNSKEYWMINSFPNPEMSSFNFRLAMTQNAIIHGNAFAEIERNMLGQAVAMWPIPSQNVELYRTPEGNLVYKIIGGSTIVAGQDVYLPFRDVFHLRNFHTKDGLVGQGVVAYAAEVLGISMGADRLAGSLFNNGGLPSGVLEVEGTLSDEAYERVKDSWKQAHSGRKAGGVAVLENGLKYKPVSMSPDILQFLDSRKFNVIEIARFLGVPPSKLFDNSSSTYSNQEQFNLEVATDTFDAWAKAYESEADMKILNNRFGGRKTEMDLYAMFRGDMTTRANYFSKMMSVGAMNPNEIRIKEGLAGYDGGDRYYIATNNYSPADRIDEIVDAQVAKGKTATQGASSPDGDDEDTTQTLEKAAIEFLTRGK